MHPLVSRLIFVALLFCFSSKLLAHVELDYPQGGETFIAGQTVLIQWHIAVPHETLNWDLHFSADGGNTWTPLQLNMPLAQLSYEWTVPDTTTLMGKIRVFMNNVDQDYLDISGNFTIVPNTMPPILDAPAQDIVIECNPANHQAAIQAWLNNHGGAAVTNFCDNLTWSHDFLGLVDECGATGFEEVTFTAMDECGFVITTATLIISDTSPPVISVAASDRMVECNGIGNATDLNLWLISRGGAQASDACGTITWSNNFTNLSDGCGMTGSALVTFIATDACGNTSTTVATFTIVDTNRPDMGHPAEHMTIECNSPGQQLALNNWLDNNGNASMGDACGLYTWTNDFTGLTDECGESGMATVKFTATDECGNATHTTAQFTVIDLTPPVFMVFPRDTTFVCGPDQQDVINTWLANNGGASGMDDCSSITWSNDYSSIVDSCNFEKLITFSLQDECGNTNTKSALIRLVDTTVRIPVGFLDFSYVWTEVAWTINSRESSRYTFDANPTEISGKTYYELLESHGEHSENWGGTEIYLREENNIVYFKEFQDDYELFNFNLMVGDTFDSPIDVPMVVESIGVFELLNGERRKQFNLRCIEDDHPVPENLTVWVEGIGNIDGLFDNNDGCQFDGTSYSILCMYRNDTLIYDHPDIDSCWLLAVATNEPIQEFISVYPNPANDVLTIDAGLIKSFPLELSILDMQGRVVMRDKITDQVTTITVDQIIPGLYLLRLVSNKGLYTSKVIIE